MRRVSSLMPARTCVMRGSKSRAALSARLMSASLASISASAESAGDGVERRGFGVAEAADAVLRGAAGDEGGGARGGEQALAGEVVGEGEAGALAGNDADAAAERDALATRS